MQRISYIPLAIVLKGSPVFVVHRNSLGFIHLQSLLSQHGVGMVFLSLTVDVHLLDVEFFHLNLEQGVLSLLLSLLLRSLLLVFPTNLFTRVSHKAGQLNLNFFRQLLVRRRQGCTKFLFDLVAVPERQVFRYVGLEC